MAGYQRQSTGWCAGTSGSDATVAAEDCPDNRARRRPARRFTFRHSYRPSTSVEGRPEGAVPGRGSPDRPRWTPQPSSRSWVSEAKLGQGGGAAAQKTHWGSAITGTRPTPTASSRDAGMNLFPPPRHPPTDERQRSTRASVDVSARAPLLRHPDRDQDFRNLAALVSEPGQTLVSRLCRCCDTRGALMERWLVRGSCSDKAGFALKSAGVSRVLERQRRELQSGYRGLPVCRSAIRRRRGRDQRHFVPPIPRSGWTR